MIAILCSSLGLGHYVPGLLVREELTAANLASEVFVFERFIGAAQRDAIVKSRSAYQRNATLLRIGQKLIPKLHAQTPVDDDAIRRVLDPSAISHFVVLSGFWVPTLAQLEVPRTTPVDLLHVDSVSSPSWQAVEHLSSSIGARHVWLSNFTHGRIEHRIDVNCIDIAFSERPDVIVAHGGGWAVGSYKTAARDVASAGYDLHVVLPPTAESPAWASREYRLDPNWEPWNAHLEAVSFPPLRGDTMAGKTSSRPYHDLLEVSRHAKGVLSKPGGATILDSLAAGTPLIYVDPQGDHEAHNAELWRSLGLAISLEEWARSSFDPDILYRMHLSLQRARRLIPSYVRELIRTRP